MANEILPNEDFEISEFLRKNLTKKGVQFHLNSSVIDIQEQEGLELSYKNVDTKKISTYSFDKILVAVGIEGNIKNLGLENTSIQIKNNQIVTYEHGKTDEKNIFAIGDVAGAPWLAHKASHEGIHCVEYIAGLKKNNLEEKMIIPSMCVLNPQVASIGLTEKKAKCFGIKY